MSKQLLHIPRKLWYPDRISQETELDNQAGHPISRMLDETPRVRALRELRRMIEEGILAAGESIPPERDIAARLGVSLSSIQRALKVLEQDGVLVRGRGRLRKVVTRQVVEDIGLLSDTVVVFANDGYVQPIIHPVRGWAAFVAVGALHALNATGEHTMVVKPQEITPEKMQRLLRGKPMGLVIPDASIAGWNSAYWASMSQKAGVPVVVYGEEVGCEAFDRIVPDHEQGAYELTQFLISRGRRGILQHMMPGNASQWMLARRKGYERAMHEAGLAPLPSFCIPSELGSLSWLQLHQLQVQAALGALVMSSRRHPIDALMAISDWCIPAFAQAIEAWGKIPNQDIDVVGYDEFWEEAKLPPGVQPARPLATVDKNNLESGQQMINLLRERVAGKLPAEPQRRLIKPILKVVEN